MLAGAFVLVRWLLLRRLRAQSRTVAQNAAPIVACQGRFRGRERFRFCWSITGLRPVTAQLRGSNADRGKLLLWDAKEAR